MGKATVYCEICGEVIPGDDFTKGRAVHHEEKDYCAKCKHEISHLLPPGEDPDGLARKTSRIRTVDPNASGVRKSSGVRAPSGIRRTAAQGPAVASTPARGTPQVNRGNGQREHPSQLRAPTAGPASSQEKKLYLVGGGALLLVILVIAVASWKSSSADKDKENQRAAREQAAKEAYLNCERYAQAAPGSFDPLLLLINDSKASVQGTDWEVQLAALQRKAEEGKRKKEARDALVAKIDSECLRIGSEPKAAREIKGNLEKYREEVGEDKELQEKIAQGIEEARRAAVQADFEEVNQYVLQNPNDYEPALDKYHTVKEELADFPQDFQQSMMPQIDQRVEWVKQGRETAASGMWQSVESSADQYRGQHDYAEARRQVNNFLLNDQFKNCKAMDDARAYLRTCDQEEQAWKEEQNRNQPPPNDPNPPGPGPGPGPNAGARVTLFDGTNMPSERRGATAKWEIVGSELHVTSAKDTVPPDDKLQISDYASFPNHLVEKCVLEFDARIVKGGVWFGIGVRQEGGAVKLSAGAALRNPGVFKPDTFYHFKLDYDGRTCMLTVDGGGAESLDMHGPMNAPGRGAIAIGIFEGCEVHIRKIEVTEK